MNQILSVENNKSRDKKEKIRGSKEPREPIEINKILKFFSIAIIIFGIFMIGTGSYSMYKNSQEDLSKTKPKIHVEEIAEAALLLKVSHNKSLSKVTYSWNDEQSIEIECNGEKEITQEIEIPIGTNILSIYASDINGQEVTYKQPYNLKENININIEVEGNNLKVTASGENELSYMTYRWDEEEETKVDINDTKIEQKIEIPVGLHTLTLIVVDSNNQTTTKVQEVKGVTKPKLEVTTDGLNFIIKASDEQGLKRIELIIDETKKYKADLTGRTEFEYKVPLNDGENRIEVTIYNQNDISEKSKKKVTK